MIIHISPTCYTESTSIILDSVEIPELSVLLTSADLRTTTPYPNKKYKIGSLSNSDRTLGLTLLSQNHINKFNGLFCWLDTSSGRVFSHEVNYIINDSDYDAVSDSSCLWGACCKGFSSRWIKGQPQTPLLVNPRLDINPTTLSNYENCSNGKIKLKKQSIIMPTIEPERLEKRKPYAEPLPLDGLEIF